MLSLVHNMLSHIDSQNVFLLQHAAILALQAADWPLQTFFLFAISLYWDGVLYTRRDNFLAFYTTILRTGRKYLAFLIRFHLSCSA